MIASEKARELVASFEGEITFYGQTKKEQVEEAKNMALKCVNEIMEATNDLADEYDFSDEVYRNATYWEKVKEYIIKT